MPFAERYMNQMVMDKHRLFDLLEALVLPIMLIGLYFIRREQYGDLCIAGGVALLGIRLARWRLHLLPQPTEVGALFGGVSLLTSGLLLALGQDFIVSLVAGLIVGMIVVTIDAFIRESKRTGLE